MTQLSARRPSAVGLASLEHWAYSEIKESIISLALPPGTTLVEAQLAEQLGVSKTPLRAALLQLEREGFVVSVPYKGSSVTPITVESVRQLAQIRFALEGYAVYNAAMSFSPEDFAAIDTIIEAQERAEAAGNLDETIGLDRRFHDYFIERLHNPAMSAIAREMSDHRRRLRNAMVGEQPDPASVRANHRSIAEAIRSGDAAGAYRLSIDIASTYFERVEEALRRGVIGRDGQVDATPGRHAEPASTPAEPRGRRRATRRSEA